MTTMEFNVSIESPQRVMGKRTPDYHPLLTWGRGTPHVFRPWDLPGRELRPPHPLPMRGGCLPLALPLFLIACNPMHWPSQNIWGVPPELFQRMGSPGKFQNQEFPRKTTNLWEGGTPHNVQKVVEQLSPGHPQC